MIQLNQTPQRLLVVAPAIDGIAHIVTPLMKTGCRIERVATAHEAMDRAADWRPEWVVIEDPVQGMSAVELTLRLRAMAPADAPPTIIMSVANHATDDASPHASLQPGSDPLLGTGHEISCDGVRLDRICHRVWADEEVLHLTPTEFNLLWELMRRPGRVLHRRELAALCRSTTLPVQSRTIDAHVKSIRRKLRRHGRRVETVHGVGYRFAESLAQSSHETLGFNRVTDAGRP